MMGYRMAADLILVLHLSFMLFVLCGGLLCLRHTRWAWLHLPAMAWGVWVEWTKSICPLTPLENHFRQLAAGQAYPEGFIESYLVPLIYPGQLGATTQCLAGALVLVINALVYLLIFHKLREHPTSG